MFFCGDESKVKVKEMGLLLDLGPCNRTVHWGRERRFQEPFVPRLR